jgi:hypothetical protein
MLQTGDWLKNILDNKVASNIEEQIVLDTVNWLQETRCRLVTIDDFNNRLDHFRYIVLSQYERLAMKHKEK